MFNLTRFSRFIQTHQPWYSRYLWGGFEASRRGAERGKEGRKEGEVASEVPGGAKVIEEAEHVGAQAQRQPEERGREERDAYDGGSYAGHVQVY
mgnify:CR=1 FL=1